MRSFRDARKPIQPRTTAFQTELRMVYTWSFLSSLPGRGRANSSGKLFFFGCNTERFGNFNARSRFNEPRLGIPNLCVCLRIVDDQVELDRIAIDTMVTFDRPHLIAVRLALRA